uniref:Uncharacterized protein n=1 Tax=Triticum urartu TaxID=4572 RepID=A0A8R7VAR5_TRIUA
MAARLHLRHKFCPRTSCLLPPGPPPSIQTPPRPSKEINFEPRGLPRPTNRSIRPALNVVGAATTRTHGGKGGGGGADASGLAHPCASDGWPKHVGAAHPSSQPPHRTHPYATPPRRPTQHDARP